MKTFTPNYTHLENAARNKEATRLPLYEHIICNEIMEEILNRRFADLYHGKGNDLVEYYRTYCQFFKDMGYDTVSYEECSSHSMPGSGALGNSSITPAIQNAEDFRKYPWQSIPDMYFKTNQTRFATLAQTMPAGMKAVGGVGNGVFECVQDLVGFENLCYLKTDDPELYSALFKQVGDVLYEIWSRFLAQNADTYCVLRFGDDLGFKSNTMLSSEDIREHIIPQYKRIISLVHQYNKPFLLHSCGSIFDVMEDLIDAGIDAKHSNEDQIAPFPQWVERYSSRIGNFGGIDTDAVCRLDKNEMREYITNVVAKCTGQGGFAFGSGNSIPDYVPTEQFLMMNEIIRSLRKE